MPGGPKKATVNIDKSEYVIVNGTGREQPLETCLENGKLMKKPEMQDLGCWIDQTGTYGVNIKKSDG